MTAYKTARKRDSTFCCMCEFCFDNEPSGKCPTIMMPGSDKICKFCKEHHNGGKKDANL